MGRIRTMRELNKGFVLKLLNWKLEIRDSRLEIREKRLEIHNLFPHFAQNRSPA